jgi:hypothetical protein
MKMAGLDHQHRSGAAKHPDKQEHNGSDGEVRASQTDLMQIGRGTRKLANADRFESAKRDARAFHRLQRRREFRQVKQNKPTPACAPWAVHSSQLLVDGVNLAAVSLPSPGGPIWVPRGRHFVFGPPAFKREAARVRLNDSLRCRLREGRPPRLTWESFTYTQRLCGAKQIGD